MPLWIKKSPSEWVPGTKIWVKKSPTEWVPALKAWIKQGATWVQFWPKSGPFATVAPFFSSDSGGNDRIIEPIIYGTTFYGQRGSWDGNGGTISSYTYKLDSVTSATIGEGTVANIIPETSMGSTSIAITANSSDYDGKWMLFTVKATRSDGIFGTEDTDNTDTGTGYRIPVIKNKPTLGTTNTTLWINGSPGITTKPQAGDAVSLIATWDSTENKSIDATRTITKWYRSSTFPTLNTTSPKAASGGYYETTGATLLGTGIAYVVTSADNNSYIFANQEVFNSFTDYNYGTTEGNGIKTGAAFTQTVGAPYSFAMGNTLYPSTNGSVGFDSGYSGTALPSSGRHLFVYGLDLVSVSTKHWSNNKDYIIQYTGGQVFNPTVAAFQITYQVKFSTDHPSYALVRIINKGSNVPQPTYIGYYEGSTQISTVAGPYVLDTGSTYRINFNGTAGTTSGITFAGVNNAAFLTDAGAGSDNTFYTLVTGTFQYALPTITFNTPTIGSTSISYTVTSTGNDFASYDYIVRTGSHTGTVFTSGSLQTGTLSITGLSNATTYYIQVDPYNSQNQNGTRMFFDATTTSPPGVPTSLTRSTGNAGSKTFSWSAPTTGGSVTSYEYQLNSTGWTSNGSSTSVALTGLSGTNTFQVRAIGTGGTGTSASTGSFVIPTINSGPTAGSITSSGATISWTSTNQSSYSLSVPGATGTPFTGTTGTSTSISLSSSTTYTPTLTITSSTGDTATVTGSSFTTSAPAPSPPTITSSSSTTTSITLNFTLGANSTSTRGYIGGNLDGSTTGTSYTFLGLQPGTSYSLQLFGFNGTVQSSTSSGGTYSTQTGAALTPSFGSNISTTGGFFGSVINYDAAYTWGISTSVGSVVWSAPSGTNRSFTVSGLSSGQSATVTVTTSRTGYSNGSAQTTGSASTIQYTVTWNANGGSGGGTTGPFNAGVAHTAPSPGTRSGFTFSGYYNTPSGDFLYGPISSGGSFTPPSNITMWARWAAIVPNVTQITSTGLGNTSAPYIRFTITSTDAASLSIMLYRSATSSTGPWTALSSASVQNTSGTLVADFSSRTGTTSNWYYVDVTPYFSTGGTGTAGTTRTSRVKRGSDTTTTTVYP